MGLAPRAEYGFAEYDVIEMDFARRLMSNEMPPPWRNSRGIAPHAEDVGPYQIQTISL